MSVVKSTAIGALIGILISLVFSSPVFMNMITGTATGFIVSLAGGFE